jgi:hypothetical protein
VPRTTRGTTGFFHIGVKLILDIRLQMRRFDNDTHEPHTKGVKCCENNRLRLRQSAQGIFSSDMESRLAKSNSCDL